MRSLPTILMSLILGAAGAAQGCIALAPSGQPVLAAIRPQCRNNVPAAVVQVAGNPAFALFCSVIAAGVPAGSPMFLVLGFPLPPPVPIGAPPLNPAYGLPGLLAMPSVVVTRFAGVAGTQGNPLLALPIPPGLGPLGLVLSAQMVVFTAGGAGLTGATGIVI